MADLPPVKPGMSITRLPTALPLRRWVGLGLFLPVVLLVGYLAIQGAHAVRQRKTRALVATIRTMPAPPQMAADPAQSRCNSHGVACFTTPLPQPRQPRRSKRPRLARDHRGSGVGEGSRRQPLLPRSRPSRVGTGARRSRRLSSVHGCRRVCGRTRSRSRQSVISTYQSGRRQPALPTLIMVIPSGGQATVPCAGALGADR